jgi:hypothetical protein
MPSSKRRSCWGGGQGEGEAQECPRSLKIGKIRGQECCLEAELLTSLTESDMMDAVMRGSGGQIQIEQGVEQ